MKYSVKDLIKIASTPSTEPKFNTDNDVERFILSLKIKAGSHAVKNSVIYKAYCAWSSRPLKHRSFHSYFAQFFEQQRAKTYRYHLLNYRATELLNKIDNMKIKIYD